MTNRWIIIGLLLLGAMGLEGLVRPSLAETAEKPWVSKVISVQGRVMVNRHGRTDWVPLHLNDTLFAGDRVRVETNSRAGIVLHNDAVLRLDQNSTLVFTAIQEETTFILKLINGAANFFSRRPRSLKVLTPFVNGVVEGTEFYVQVDESQTRIDLFEGRILAQNRFGELEMVKGQMAVATEGSAPKGRILVQSRDSVQWALYYPPVLTLGPDDLPPVLKDSLARFSQGRTLDALDGLEQAHLEAYNAKLLTYRAALLLHLGRVADAGNTIQQVLSLNPDNSEAMALQAVVAVVQNRKKQALALAQKAVQSNPKSAAARIALSYALQAGFNLQEAVNASRAAVAQAPDNSTAWSRLAELQLSIGQQGRALQAAKKAVALNPHAAHAHAIFGYAYLTQLKTDKAQKAFDRAIALDSAAPLPRLGLGLALIRKGRLEQGRSEIEIAAGLDPVNALIRSYLGKAYFDEKRGPLDEKQLKIAKVLDPNDPTPWLYDAIRKQTLNRPVEALQDLQQSMHLNDNRAVYRSRLLLDQDRAARGVSLARIYDDLGFTHRALLESTRSLSTDPTNYSAHRFLADSYIGLPQRQISRVSERLQAQLLQPINANPAPPRLSVKGLNLVSDVGPGAPSFNEFTALFDQNKPHLSISGMVGNKDTYSEEVVLSGLADRFSYSVGQYRYRSDGFRENGEIEHDISNVFTQVALTNNVSVQFEYRYRDSALGDIRQELNPAFVPNQSRNLKQDIWRAGLHLSPSSRSDVIASYMYSGRKADFANQGIASRLDTADDADGYNAEAQYLLHGNRINFLLGGGLYRVDSDTVNTLTVEPIPLPPPLPPPSPTIITEEVQSENKGENFYLYSHIRLPAHLVWTIGMSYEAYEESDPQFDLEKVNPKLGIQWDVTDKLRLRAAYIENIKRQLAVDQTIEPTQVAGFNQFFDDLNGTRIQLLGAAMDVTLTDGLFAGLEFTRRELTEKSDRDEERYRGYLYWAPHPNWSMNAECLFERDLLNLDFNLETTSVPVAFRYFGTHGLFGQFGATPVWQEMIEDDGTILNDNFIVVDAAVGYRFPNRLGMVSVEVGNLFDEAFRYQDAYFKTLDKFNVVQPFWPERTVLARVVLNF